MKKKLRNTFWLPFVLMFLLVSCSTQKNTFITRNYHNLTAHYNVFFNGDEAMKAGLTKIETQVEEDYTKILPIFKESLPKTETLVSSDMNTAIDKGTKLIKFHSITKPPEENKKGRGRNRKRTATKPEYNKWVDDAYIMIGRAYFYRKEYIQAISSFQLIIRKFKDEPVKYEAYLWLVRCYSESERYTEAGEIIQTLEGDNLFPEKLGGELAIIAADLHLKQQQYDEAIRYLSIGIKKIKGNKRKTRYTYILAQLYQETGKQEQALEAYHQVIRRGPDYKMLFNARINSAGVFSGQGDAALLKKELNKMRRRRWNAPFLDQIYYALGNIAYNEGKTNEAIEMYRKSVATSVDNTYQRALSCITLGELYFGQREYIPSAQYYDSAIVLIDENYPNYPSISEKYTNLNSLAQNLLRVETEDSLQALALLSEDERNKKIDQWIAAEKEKQQKMMDDGIEGDGTMNYYRSTNSRMRLGGNTGTSWYFYNPTTVSYGKKEFEQMWGKRQEEDNWRRSDKSVITFDETTGEPIQEELSYLAEEEEKREDDPTTRNFYLQDIPLTDSMLTASHTQIRDALFNAGTTLKNEFNDYEQAIGCFTQLNSRYPKNVYELSSWFFLWDSYQTLNRPDSASWYRDQITGTYPESNYAKYLINPNYFIEEESRKDSLNRLYQHAFLAYKNREFDKAARYSRMALEMNPDTSLLPKIEFVRIVSESRGQGNKRLADSLKTYISRFTVAEPAALAKQILTLIGDDKLSDYQELVNSGYLNERITNAELLGPQGDASDPLAGKWDPAPDLLHYFVIAFPMDTDIDVNRLKYDIANYNLDHYTLLDFDIETENLNNDTRLLIVRNFDNKESAMVYFLSIVRNPGVFKTLAGKEYYNFVASNNNYREMLSDRNYTAYAAYFARNYSQLTSGHFTEADLASPEALMARLNEDPADQLKEQGEFVMVTVPDSISGQQTSLKEQIFSGGYDTPHAFLVVIGQDNFGTGYLMRDLMRYNLSAFRDKRFRVVPGRMTGKTLLSVTPFPNAWEAMEYLKTTGVKNELFASIGNTPFEKFIISEANLEQLVKTGDLDGWKRFYQANYISRKPVQPARPEQDKPHEKEAAKPTVKTDTIQEPETKAPVPESLVEEPIPERTNTDTLPVNSASAGIEKQPEASPFVFESESPHSLAFVLPSKSPNQSLLITYLTRFNAIGYRNAGLQITTKAFDDFRSVVLVSGLESFAPAKDYLDGVTKDSRVAMSLRGVEYRSFLITEENLAVLFENSDLQGYLTFYAEHYK
ncbi:MAG TPA: tetratricopeptide repeat protein [Prolixibacteraceae bacterium]|nr:tetratricopeptide repeat protein [Prolixibacteraceae bacterium]